MVYLGHTWICQGLLVSSLNQKLEKSIKAIIYRRAWQVIKVSLKSPQLSSSLPAPVDLAANIKNAARCPAPAALGGGGCLSAHQPVLFWDYLSKAYQSNLSITRRQPSQSLRQYILALAPASPALLSRFNFIFIRSTEKDIFSRSKGHSEHERNTVTGQKQVIWYPHRKTSCFRECFGG